MRIGNYEIIIIKKVEKKPARLEKAEVEDDGMKYIRALDSKLNRIILYIAVLALMVLCNILVPATYGFFTHC